MLALGGLGYFSINAQFLNGSTYQINDFVFFSRTKAVFTMPAQHPPPVSSLNTELLQRSLGKHNTDSIRISLNIKISSTLEDQYSTLFHAITDMLQCKRHSF